RAESVARCEMDMDETVGSRRANRALLLPNPSPPRAVRDEASARLVMPHDGPLVTTGSFSISHGLRGARSAPRLRLGALSTPQAPLYSTRTRGVRAARVRGTRAAEGSVFELIRDLMYQGPRKAGDDRRPVQLERVRA